MSAMTAERRYWQAVRKQQLINRRLVSDFLGGKTSILVGCTNQEAMIAAIQRAYDAGFRDGRSSDLTDSPAPREPAVPVLCFGG